MHSMTMIEVLNRHGDSVLNPALPSPALVRPHTRQFASWLLAFVFLLGAALSTTRPARANAEASQTPDAGATVDAVPLLLLEAKSAISSEQKTACVLKLVIRQDAHSSHTNSWAGVVRFHGA